MRNLCALCVKYFMKMNLINLILLISVAGLANAQTTIGLIQHSIGTLDDGYVLFSPTPGNNTYLIDKCGREVKTWTSNYKPGHSAYLLNDGTLLRAGDANNGIFNSGGSGGIIEKIDWNGNVIWNYRVSDATKCQHHDIRALPNGNVLVIAWESKTDIDAIAHGRDPALVPNTLWSEQILEIQPVGSDSGIVVWEWHLWDHLIQDFDATKSNYGVVSAQLELININYKAANVRDWIHMNSIDYNPTLDQILVSSHSFDEIWIIDHSTSTTQAASHAGGNSGRGGDLLYRWGNPRAYKTGTTTQFFGQHNAHWIDSGLPYQNQIMVFNNGIGRPGGDYSTVEIINPPVAGFGYTSTLPYLPAATSWIYNSGNPNNFYSTNISGAQQLSNGNVLICDGPAGIFFEIDSTGTQVWKYVNPVSASGVMTQGAAPGQNVTFRCNFYPATFSGFAGHTLIADSIIEDANTISDSCDLINSIDENNFVDDPADILIYPNPSTGAVTISLPEGEANVLITDIFGLEFIRFITTESKTTLNLDESGLYIVNVKTKRRSEKQKVLVIRE